MKEITSKRTGKIQIIPDETWENIIARGWTKKFIKKDIQERKFREPIIIPPEIKTKKTKNG